MPSCQVPTPLRALLLATTVALTACATDGDLPFDSDKSDESDPLRDSNGYNNNPLLIPFDGKFDMCLDAPADVEVAYGADLNAAKWLSFISANEYAHYAHFAPVLEEMGFGDEGEGNQWVEIGREIMRSRADEEAGLIEEGSSAYFERAIVQNVIPGKKIQFFAAGEIRKNEFRDQSTQMLWVEHRTEPVVIISFRGTQVDKTADILADINIFRRDLEGYGPVHGGFLNAYEGVREILEEKLEAESGRGLQIWITGHSLGGALATLASTTVIDRMKTDPSYQLNGVYTFGQPRVGNSAFVENLEAAYDEHAFEPMRYRHGDDLVSRIPWRSLGYRHAGQLMHLAANGDFDFDPVDQDPGDVENAEGSMADHAIDAHYYRRIVEHLESGLYPSFERHCNLP